MIVFFLPFLWPVLIVVMWWGFMQMIPPDDD
jgi:hypothetical protein